MPAQGHEIGANEFTAYLRKKLPVYMIPSSFVKLDEMPLNTNGKIDRKRLPDPDYVEIEKRYVPPTTEAEKLLANIWSSVLRVEKVGVHDSFFELGGDSILAIQVVAKANDLGFRLTPRQIFEHRTIAELTRVDGTAPRVEAEQGMMTGDVPLTPIQRWFFDFDLPNPHHWNMSLLLDCSLPLSTPLLEQSLALLMAHHDALRLRFIPESRSWLQTFSHLDSIPFSHFDLSDLPDHSIAETILDHSTRLQKSLDLTRGPIVRMASFELGEGRGWRLLWIIHHLAVDVVSWRILLEDLEKVYRQKLRGEEVRLAAKTTSFKRWAEEVERYARSEEGRKDVEEWGRRIGEGEGCEEEEAGVNEESRSGEVRVEMGEEETREMIEGVVKRMKVKVSEALMGSLMEGMWRSEGRREVIVEVEGHGREEEIGEGIDVTRTVGWFTSIYPVKMERKEGERVKEVVERVKEEMRKVRRGGIGWGIRRWMRGEGEGGRERRALSHISFNYTGQFDQMISASAAFTICSESAGQDCASDGRRPYPLEVVAGIVEGRLRINWMYSADVYPCSKVEGLAHAHIEALRRLIKDCAAIEGASHTPSDYPLAKLDQSSFDNLVATNPNIEDIYTLSSMQQEMLIHTLSTPESDLGFSQICWTLGAGFDLSKFKRAWQEVVHRHPILRTSFCWEGLVEPHQVVSSEVDLNWRQHDWRGEEWREERLEALLREDRRRGFDLSSAPLMRFIIVRQSDEMYHFIWSFHHILLDGWSMALLIREVLAFYDDLCQGNDPAPSRSWPYRDYIAWLQQQDASRSESFWRETLKGFEKPTPLPFRNRPAKDIYGEESILLSEVASSAIESLARQSDLTVNTIVHGAWALILSRYSNRQDIVFGATVSGRPAEISGIESMIGMFINTLPVRVRVEREAPLLAWLKGLQARQAESRQHENVPRSQIHACSEVPWNLSLFESTLVFENYPLESGLLLDETTPEFWLRHHFGTRANTPITLVIAAGSRLQARIAYDGRKFDPADTLRMLRQLETMLAEMAANPGRSLEELIGCLPDAEIESPGCGGDGRKELGVEEVEAALRRHPDLREAAVVRREDAPGESRLAAYFVFKEAPGVAVQQLRNYLKEELTDRLPPLDFVSLPGLPLLPDGGVDIEALPAPEFARSIARVLLVGDIASHDIIEFQLARIWEDVFSIRPIGTSDNFFDLGGNSILALMLVSEVRKRLSYDLPLSALVEGATIKEMAAILRRRTATLPWSPLVAIRPHGSKRPFFCVHAAGGNVLGFVDLARYLDADRPFYGLQSIGLDGVREPYVRVGDMASHYIEEIRTVQSHGPYLVGGLSFGGVVAFEMARQLREQGQEVALLALIDTWSPVYEGRLIFPELLPSDDFALLTQYIKGVKEFCDKNQSLMPVDLPQMGLNERLDVIISLMGRAGLFGEIEVEQVRRVMKVHLNSARALRDYVPQVYRGPITIFRATEIGPLSQYVVMHPGLNKPELVSGWGDLSSEPLELLDVPGDHITIIVEPNVRVLAERLNACMDRVLNLG